MVVAGIVALAADGPHELNDRVVEVELQAELRVVGLVVEGLVLGDEDLKVGGGEALALGILKEDVGALERGLEVRGKEAAAGAGILDRDVGARHDDGVLELGKVDVNLHAVELERREGERVAAVEGEPEGKGHVELTALARVAHELRAGVALANELGKAAARLARQLLPHEEEVIVQGVNRGPTDDNLGLGHEVLADRVDVVRPDVAELGAHVVGAVLDVGAAVELRRVAILLAQPAVLGGRELGHLLAARGIGGAIVHVLGEGLLVRLAAGRAGLVHEGLELGRDRAVGRLLGDDARELDHDVHVVDEVTLTVERDLTLGAKGDARVEGLIARLDRETSVLRVAKLPEGERGVRRKVGVDGPLGDNLNEGTGSSHAFWS